jgi:hypothetical protein
MVDVDRSNPAQNQRSDTGRGVVVWLSGAQSIARYRNTTCGCGNANLVGRKLRGALMAANHPIPLGLTRSDLDFAKPGLGGWGKNKFNNVFPVALCNFMDRAGLDLPYVVARPGGDLGIISRSRISVADAFGVAPADARFAFELPFKPFERFVQGSPNKSDLVVKDVAGEHVRPLEIKLTVVPDSQTVRLARTDQGPEFVTRPLMIELLATNICRGYGTSGRSLLNSILLEHLGNPNNWDWKNEKEMFSRLGRVAAALAAVVLSDSNSEQPMVLQPIWRTLSDSIELDNNCFDCFVWSDSALATVYAQSALDNQGLASRRISRESRSAVWLIKMLWDYSTAGQLTMNDVVRAIAYSHQQDKAGAFGGRTMHRYLRGAELESPRVRREHLPEIIGSGGASYLNPERRLDASLYMASRIEEFRRTMPEAPAQIAAEN